MGEAKRRAATRAHAERDEAAWAVGLPESHRTVLRVAKALHRRFPDHGACYRYALFLKYHLELRHGIQGEAIVGYVNDGTDDEYGYHAWYECDGLMTDVALCRPMEPSIQRPGATIILGRETAPGWRYSYHRERPVEGLAALMRYRADPRTAAAANEAEEIQIRMSATVRSNELIRAYLDGAPDGIDYERMAAGVERQP